MPVPDYQSFMLPLLRRLGDGAPWRFADLYEALAEESRLTGFSVKETFVVKRLDEDYFDR